MTLFTGNKTPAASRQTRSHNDINAILHSEMDSDPKGKRLAFLFFHNSRRQGDQCVFDECNEIVKKPGTGFSNLASHIRCNHSELIGKRIEKNTKKVRPSFNHWCTMQRHIGYMRGLRLFSSACFYFLFPKTKRFKSISNMPAFVKIHLQNTCKNLSAW